MSWRCPTFKLQFKFKKYKLWDNCFYLCNVTCYLCWFVTHLKELSQWIKISGYRDWMVPILFTIGCHCIAMSGNLLVWQINCQARVQVPVPLVRNSYHRLMKPKKFFGLGLNIFYFILTSVWLIRNIMSTAHHTKLQINGPSGHCSNLDFHPPEVQQPSPVLYASP